MAAMRHNSEDAINRYRTEETGRRHPVSLDIRMLRYFLAVAEEGNITWAAQLLRISQPTLSRQIKQLEQDLGVTLLVRGNQSVSLTAEGELLKERAQTIVSLSDKTAFELQHAGSELDGIISVGCGEIRGMAWLAMPEAPYPRDSHADKVEESFDDGVVEQTAFPGGDDMAGINGDEPLVDHRHELRRLDGLEARGADRPATSG